MRPQCADLLDAAVCHEELQAFTLERVGDLDEFGADIFERGELQVERELPSVFTSAVESGRQRSSAGRAKSTLLQLVHEGTHMLPVLKHLDLELRLHRPRVHTQATQEVRNPSAPHVSSDRVGTCACAFVGPTLDHQRVSEYPPLMLWPVRPFQILLAAVLSCSHAPMKLETRGKDMRSPVLFSMWEKQRMSQAV